MRALRLLLAALILPAGAAGAASFELGVDPRIELLGVVSRLAGLARAEPDSRAYRERIDRRFGRFRDHPAVKLYRKMGASDSREEAAATILIYFSEPPELALKDPRADIHYVNGEGEREQMHRLVWELRDFARVSDFMSFFREESPYYERLAAGARAMIGTPDPVGEIEKLLGVSLSGRPRYYVAPLARRARAFIVPYPLPPAQLGTKVFDPYAITAAETPAFAWLEPLYSFVDPSFYYFEKLNVADPGEFYGEQIARCRALSPSCVKEYLVDALERRLVSRTRGRLPPEQSPAYAGTARDRRYLKALSERLDEYERDRARYPTLWSFYPRLMSVFYELAHDGGAPARPLAVPAEPAIRAVADFFDPKVVERLK